ncbi:biotin/lipoate A/B protein ligase [[Leptolyngbya] sp. PCC 7376]|uniref:lipoate--protein ligase family protein n=1 Tax=[Leptolyngbya] sp. PCC 7376 TaxID=111781 RepID=UPI00029EE4A3|nr:lipoate--protein ligase family protein [[Leptolyngbya] sp. PCC 7376]AFY37777.1 biotin/lipoate A/B protein ligase [[Leptolyngbya] sp. PCC 7376]
MSPNIWRYISPLEADGATQMAIDEWLLNQHLAGKMPSVLRFYTWKPVAISLGHNQRKYPKTWHNLTYNGKKIDIVRRPSGGRAVLHQGDLTYAIITSDMKGDRCQKYKKLCEFLIAGFRELGIALQYGDCIRNYAHHDNCFRTHTSADLVTADGYKLIGSAQLRRKNAVLQHGSIRLNPDAQLYQNIFNELLLDSSPLPNLSITTLIQTLLSSIKEQQGIQLQEQDLSATDRQNIHSDNEA